MCTDARVRVCARTRAVARKGALAAGGRGSGRAGDGGDCGGGTRVGGVAELIPESNVQREEDGERRGVVSRNVRAGEAT